MHKTLQMKRTLRTALLVLLLSAAGTTKTLAQEYSYVTIGELKYHLYVNTLTATVACHVDGTDATGNLTIPSSVTYTSYEWINGQYVPVTRTYSVTAIGGGAFENCSGLTGSLSIPNPVTLVGGDAFWGCSGFTGSLTIPNSVTTIEPGAFGECSGFTGDLVIPNSVMSIGGSAFCYCTGFNGNLIIGDSVMSINGCAFQGCSGFIGDLIIPNSVTFIGDCAFEYCRGFNGILTIPNSITDIGGAAFHNCYGFSVVQYNAINCADANALWPPFSQCSGMLSIGRNVERIPANMFKVSAFMGSLTIPNSVTTIGDMAFAECRGLTDTLIIGNSVTTIGNSAFYDCNGLTSMIVWAETPPSLNDYVFRNVSKNIPVYVPCHLVDEYQVAFGWNEFTNYVESIPYHLTIESIDPDNCTVSVVQHPTCEDSQAVVKAEPTEGYMFVAWEEDGTVVSTNAVYTFTIDRDIHLVARVKSNTGVSEDFEKCIIIYPNPTNGIVFIESEDIKHITISNMLGQTIFEGNASGNVLEYDFGKHEKGVYLIRIETAIGEATKHIILMK